MKTENEKKEKEIEQQTIETFNRFKELQREYSRKHKYNYSNVELKVKCRSTYLSFEARMDQEAFEVFLLTSIPRELLLIGAKGDKLAAVD